MLKIQDLDVKEAEEGILDNLRNERCLLEEQFTEITTREEIKWRQKARIKWLKGGGFHSYANNRKTINWISALNINEAICDGPETIEEEII